MTDIKVNSDSKYVKVIAAQARGERIDSNVLQEVNDITHELAENYDGYDGYAAKQIAQTIRFAMNELNQQNNQ